MKHLAALQIFLLNISSLIIMFLLMYPSTVCWYIRTYIYTGIALRYTKNVCENCGRENDNLKICDTIRYTVDIQRYSVPWCCVLYIRTYIYSQYGIERTAHFLHFARFVFFPFAVWLKLFLFSLYVCRSYRYIYTTKTVCLRRYRLCEKLLAKRRGNK